MKVIIYKVSVMVTHTAAAAQDLCAAVDISVEPERVRERALGVIGYILRTGGVDELRSDNIKTRIIHSDE